MEEEKEEFTLYLTGGLLHFVGYVAYGQRRFSISESCCPENYNTEPEPTGV